MDLFHQMKGKEADGQTMKYVCNETKVKYKRRAFSFSATSYSEAVDAVFLTEMSVFCAGLTVQRIKSGKCAFHSSFTHRSVVMCSCW